MESIFPFVDPPETETVEPTVPIAREWAWDFKRSDFKLKNGSMFLVEGTEAVKIWLWKLFQTPRYRYVIFSWDYGHELENLIGQGSTRGFLNSEAERHIREAIGYNLRDYVTDVKNVDLSFDEGLLTIEFTAITPYGEVEMRV